MAGDLVRATLVVEGPEGYLKAIDRTGHAPLTDPPPRPRVDGLNTGDEIPDVALVDETGATRQMRDWRGRTLAVTFIYTRCPLPDFCPRMDRQFADAQQIVTDDEALRGRVQLLSISFDPAYDTPAVLATHAKKVGADPATWNFLTGAQADVESFAALFGVSVMREGSDPGSGVVHNLRTASHRRRRTPGEGAERHAVDTVRAGHRAQERRWRPVAHRRCQHSRRSSGV